MTWEHSSMRTAVSRLLLSVEDTGAHNRTPPHKPTVFYYLPRSFVLLFSIVLSRRCLLNQERAWKS